MRCCGSGFLFVSGIFAWSDLFGSETGCDLFYINIIIQCCGPGMFIPNSGSGFSVPDPGSKRHRVPNPDPQQRISIFNPKKFIRSFSVKCKVETICKLINNKFYHFIVLMCRKVTKFYIRTVGCSSGKMMTIRLDQGPQHRKIKNHEKCLL
jgi:hypothetical protein